jgi:hypothetical protein
MVANLLRLAVVLSLTVATGCAPTGLQANAGPQANAGQAATLDCSSREAYMKSLAKMIEPLNEDQRKHLGAAFAKASEPQIKAAVKEKNMDIVFKSHLLAKHLHGKTAKEILALANGPNSSPPPPPPPAVP